MFCIIFIKLNKSKNMTNEKDSIRKILEGRGVINNGVFDELRFRKLVTEPWIHTKTIKYGFDKMSGNNTKDVDNEQVIKEVVEIQEPITVVKEPVAETVEEVVETSTESVLLEEDLKEEIEEPVVETVEEAVEVPAEVPAEEPVVETVEEAVEVPAEEPVVETVEEAVEESVTEPVEEVDETPKKKASKKK